MARRKIIAGAKAFKPVKIGGRWDHRNTHAIGIDEKRYIPGTEHNPLEHRVYELPLKMFDKPGHPAREGTINRVLWVETHNGPVVLKIPRIDGYVHNTQYVDDRNLIDEMISDLVPAPKLLGVVWVKGINYKGTKQEENPNGIPVELHEAVNLKNLKQEHLKGKEFQRALEEAANINITLFRNGILYDGSKPENFCRDMHSKQVKAVDKNGSPIRSYLTYGGETKETKHWEEQMLGRNLAEFLVDLYRSNTTKPNEKMLHSAIRGVKQQIAKSGMKQKEIKRITENFEQQLAEFLRRKGMKPPASFSMHY